MPLVACPDCKQRISDLAYRCPHCGNPSSVPGGAGFAGVAAHAASGDAVLISLKDNGLKDRSLKDNASTDRDERPDSLSGVAVNSLAVPLIPQQTRLWCWAASAQMILQYLGHPPLTQCQQADSFLGRTTCCDAPTPDFCVNGGWPQFGEFGFTFQRTAPAGTGGVALTWEQLKAQIDGNQPVAFSWHFKSGGGHMLVAVGYEDDGDDKIVIVNDPWPPNTSHESRRISYDTYVDGEPENSEHWFDFYNIAQGPGGPMSGPIAPDDLQQARASADAFRGRAIKLAGAEVPGVAQASSLGQGLPVISVGLNSLSQSAPGGETPEDLLVSQATQVIFPVVLGQKVAAAGVARKQGGAWNTINGDPVWTGILTDLRLRHAAASNISADNYFVVDVRGLGLSFLGVQIAGELKLIPTLDEPDLKWKAGETLSANQVMETLKQLARTHNNLPM